MVRHTVEISLDIARRTDTDEHIAVGRAHPHVSEHVVEKKVGSRRVVLDEVDRLDTIAYEPALSRSVGVLR